MLKRNKLWHLLLALLMVTGYCPVLLAQQVTSEKAVQKESAEFREALEGAEEGNVFSMDEVAARYRYGNGTPVNYGKALYWYKKVAEKGFPEAQYSLGTMYYLGNGVPVDKKKAYNWFYKSAISPKKFSPASYSIAFMYSKGEYVQADQNKAVEWYLKAAGNTRDHSHIASLAQNALGDSYYRGTGVEKDVEMAWAWFWFAKRYGSKDAEDNLAILDKEMSLQQKRNAKEKANQINHKHHIMLDPPFLVLDEPAEKQSAALQNCPDLKGTYRSTSNSTQLYLQKIKSQNYRVVLSVPGYQLTIKDAHIISSEENMNSVYSRFPNCTLSIDNFGHLLPHVEGTAYRLRFDSQDWSKTFNTDFVLKTGNTPDGVIGMNKTSSDLPQNVRDALNKE